MEQKIYKNCYKMSLFLIKNKIINCLLKNGKKNLSENIFIKCMKELQKKSPKSSEKLVQLALTYTLFIFKFHKFENTEIKKKKKRIQFIFPVPLLSEVKKVSMAIKYILLNTCDKKFIKCSEELQKEILLSSQIKSDAIIKKNELQQNIEFYKHLFK